jgi:hypothetical protein
MTAPTSSPQHDDLDRRLGQFFRGEVPDPWPSLTPPVRMPVGRRDTRTLSAGRMALAASIAILLFGGWFLSGQFPAPPTIGSLDSGNATVPRELRSPTAGEPRAK